MNKRLPKTKHWLGKILTKSKGFSQWNFEDNEVLIYISCYSNFCSKMWSASIINKVIDQELVTYNNISEGTARKNIEFQIKETKKLMSKLYKMIGKFNYVD